MANPFQHGVIRAAMTRNISARYEDIYQEVVRSYAEAIPCRGDGMCSFLACSLESDPYPPQNGWQSRHSLYKLKSSQKSQPGFSLAHLCVGLFPSNS